MRFVDALSRNAPGLIALDRSFEDIHARTHAALESAMRKHLTREDDPRGESDPEARR